MNFVNSIDGKVGIIMLIMGILAILVAVAPMIIILFYELKKFGQKGSDYDGGKSAFSFIFIGAIALTISSILYEFINAILDNIALVKYAPMAGENGMSRAFWVASSGTTKLGTYCVNAMSTIRMFVPTLLIFIAIMFMVLSIMATFSTINVLKGNGGSDGGNLAGAVVKIFAGIVVGGIIFGYYSSVASPILNAPDINIKEIINGWFQLGMEAAIKK